MKSIAAARRVTLIVIEAAGKRCQKRDPLAPRRRAPALSLSRSLGGDIASPLCVETGHRAHECFHHPDRRGSRDRNGDEGLLAPGARRPELATNAIVRRRAGRAMPMAT
jgi:hypothetical protein